MVTHVEYPLRGYYGSDLKYDPEKIKHDVKHRSAELIDIISTPNVYTPDGGFKLERPLEPHRYRFRNIFDAPAKAPRTDLGDLSRIPAELITDIVMHLDVPTARNFSHVNRAAMAAVNSIPKVLKMRDEATEAVIGLLRLRMTASRACTLWKLWQVLHTEKCNFCPEIGQYMHLPMAVRACLACLKDGESRKHHCVTVHSLHQAKKSARGRSGSSFPTSTVSQATTKPTYGARVARSWSLE